MKYKLVIFDCDGTLVDSEPLTNTLISRMINELGIEISPEECLETFAGKTLIDITSFISANGVHLDEVAFEKEFRQRCLQIFEDKLKAIPGIEEFINSLEVPYCVASNGPHKKMKVTLPAAGLDRYFNDANTFSAYDVDKWKPDPTLFLHAAKQMKIEPKDCLVIEDTWSGAMGAVNAGMDVYVYNPHNDIKVFLDGIPNFSSIDGMRRQLK